MFNYHRFQSIYYFGLARRVDQTVAINNFRNALRNKASLNQIESIISVSSLLGVKSKEKDISKSIVIAYVYIYSIGIVIAITFLVIEFLLDFCCKKPMTNELKAF